MADPKRPRRFTDDFKRQIVGLCNGGKTRDDIVLYDCGRGGEIAGVDGRRQGLTGGREGVRGRARTVCRLRVRPGALCCGHRFRHGRNHLVECGPIKVTPTRALNFRAAHDIR